jgi:hypothetical protein
MPDKEPGPSFEQLAGAAGVDYWTVRKWLERELARRQHERYRMHAHAIERLDARLERLAAVPAEQARRVASSEWPCPREVVAAPAASLCRLARFATTRVG